MAHVKPRSPPILYLPAAMRNLALYGGILALQVLSQASIVRAQSDVPAPSAGQAFYLETDDKQPGLESAVRPRITLHLIETPTSLSIPCDEACAGAEGVLALQSDKDWNPLLRHSRIRSPWQIGRPPGAPEPWPRGEPLDDAVLPECDRSALGPPSPCLMPADYPDEVRTAIAIGKESSMGAFKLKPGRSATIAFSGEDDRNDLTSFVVQSRFPAKEASSRSMRACDMRLGIVIQ